MPNAATSTPKRTPNGAAQQNNPRSKNATAAIRERAKSAAARSTQDAKSAAAHSAQAAADDLRDASHSMETDGLAQMAVSQLAETLSNAADTVRHTDLTDLQQDVTDFARRNPALFIGGAAVLGFAVGRMVKASNRAGEQAFDINAPAGSAGPVPYTRGDL